MHLRNLAHIYELHPSTGTGRSSMMHLYRRKELRLIGLHACRHNCCNVPFIAVLMVFISVFAFFAMLTPTVSATQFTIECGYLSCELWSSTVNHNCASTTPIRIWDLTGVNKLTDARSQDADRLMQSFAQLRRSGICYCSCVCVYTLSLGVHECVCC